ncbi:MAG: hypothetical protein ACOYWZ_04380 [Bacillota bacterium]
MFYWNQENFVGLKEVGEKLVDIEGYQFFANYCLLKEKGLKKQALISLEKFIAEIRSKNIEEQRSMVAQLAALSYFNKSIHQLIPHPLHQFLLVILKDWAMEGVIDITPYRWYGYFSNDLSSYEKALEIESTDEISLIELTNACLSNVDYQTHHLSESLFIGNIGDANQSLKKAYSYVEKLMDGNRKATLNEEIQYFTRLISMWEQYKSEKREMTFPEWCNTKREKFNFWNIIYYKNK